MDANELVEMMDDIGWVSWAVTIDHEVSWLKLLVGLSLCMHVVTVFIWLLTTLGVV